MKRRMVATISMFVIGGLMGGCSDKGGSSGSVREIGTARELKSKMDSDHVVVVHALSAEHYAKGHVPGAKNIDYQTMKPEMLPSDKDQPIVFYCGGPTCPVGHNAAEKAASWGYKNVWVYKGGISDWKSSGMQVDTGASETVGG